MDNQINLAVMESAHLMSKNKGSLCEKDNKMTSNDSNEIERSGEVELVYNEPIPHYYLWTGGCGMLFALLNSCLIFCALPQHNILKQPHFWYEFMTVSVCGFIALFAAALVITCSVWMDLNCVRTWKNFVSIYIVSACAWISSNALCYTIWVIILNFRPPIPLNIHICGIITLLVAMTLLWFLIPKHIRETRHFLKRYLYYCLAQIFRNACVWGYFFLARLFIIINPSYQWILATFLQLVREFNGRVLTKLCCKAASCEKTIISITCQHDMGCRHAVFLCVALSLLASTTTSFLCLGFDFGINFMLCLKIIWNNKIHKNVLATKDNIDLQVLVLNEKVVYIVPLAYSICFLIAFYGPNATIIGNVKNNSWHFGIVENISTPIYLMGLLFFIDFLSILLWTILLKKYCKINFFDGYMHIQKEAWLVMAIQEAYALNEVNI